MKKLWWLIAILLTFTVAASAQTPVPFTLYASGAFSLPNSPDGFKDNFKTGYHGSLGLGIKMMPNFQIIGKAELHSFKFDFDNSELFAGMDGYSGGTNNMWMFGADGRFSFNLPAAPISPFVLAGAGVASIKQTEFDGPASLALSALNSYLDETQTKFYWNVGGGFDLKSGPLFSLFVQARYVSIATEGEASSFVPISLGIRLF